MEVGIVWIMVSSGPIELSVIERCPYYACLRKERFDCTWNDTMYVSEFKLNSHIESEVQLCLVIP